MSTDDSLIRLVKVGNEFWIGMVEGGAMHVSGNRLTSPRVLGKDQARQTWICVDMIGLPGWVEIPSGCPIMNVTDPDMITAYRKAVTGLVLAKEMPKGNLVSMPGGRQ